MTMIMQGTTPRALTGTGLLVVLGLSVTLLPMSPSWAQRPEDAEPPAAAPDRPEPRDSSPDLQTDREVEQSSDSSQPAKSDVRVFRFSGDAERDGASLEALERAVVALKNAREVAGKRSPESMGELNKALEQLQEQIKELAARRGDERQAERDRERLAPERRGRELQELRLGLDRRRQEARESATRRDGPEAQKNEREVEERRARIKQLTAEVELRRKALREAEMRLNQAVKQMGGSQGPPGAVTRTERFEYRINPPALKGDVHLFVPRPDQDKRFAELEERLEKLQDEIKTLKKDAPAKP